jgi:hypothetical protein
MKERALTINLHVSIYQKAMEILCFGATFLALAAPALAETTLPAAEPELEYKDFIYENMDMEKLSQLFWALEQMEIGNDQHIDGYLQINECDIFKKYNYNEFEWDGIRDAARQFITQSKKDFSTRFEIMQPLYLGRYDFEKAAFEILPAYQLNGVRRFEVIAAEKDVCDGTQNPGDYPTGIIAELSRPIILEALEMDERAAQILTEQKELQYRDVKKAAHRMDEFRDTYLVLKVKFFASQGYAKGQSGKYLPTLLAVLEGIEVYADRQKTQLLFEENYQQTKPVAAEEEEAAKSFDDFVKRREEAKKKLEEQRKLEEAEKAAKEAAKENAN